MVYKFFFLFSSFFYSITESHDTHIPSQPVYIRQRWLRLQPPPTHCNRNRSLFFSSLAPSLLPLEDWIGLDFEFIVINGGSCSVSGAGGVDREGGGGHVAEGRRRQEGGAGGSGRRRGAERDARAGGGRQLRRPRRHRQDPPKLQVQSDHGGVGDEGAGAPLPRPRAQRQHDHHRLLDARHDRLRAPQARQGVVSAQGDPGGDHVVGERAEPDQPVPGGGRRGLPAQARPPLRRVTALQPDQMIARHVGSWRI